MSLSLTINLPIFSVILLDDILNSSTARDEKLSFENLFLDEQKPEAFEYMLQAENVLLTPHIAGWTFESHEKLAQTIVDKIKKIYHL